MQARSIGPGAEKLGVAHDIKTHRLVAGFGSYTLQHSEGHLDPAS